MKFTIATLLCLGMVSAAPNQPTRMTFIAPQPHGLVKTPQFPIGPEGSSPIQARPGIQLTVQIKNLLNKLRTLDCRTGQCSQEKYLNHHWDVKFADPGERTQLGCKNYLKYFIGYKDHNPKRPEITESCGGFLRASEQTPSAQWDRGMFGFRILRKNNLGQDQELSSGYFQFEKMIFAENNFLAAAIVQIH